MIRFLARIFAFVLAATAFVLGAALLVQLRPESAGGWGVLAGAGLVVLLLPVLIYRGIMGRVDRSRLPNEGEGAGLAMGVGIDGARRRDEDGDSFDFD
jgi:hypothetical protein